MNWEAIGAVGELLGAIGVIVTLGYLAVQIRQNTRATGASTVHGINNSIADAWRPLHDPRSANVSGAETVNQLLAPFTRKEPPAAPISVPRPPTATQMTISMELAGYISLGLMIPTWGT